MSARFVALAVAAVGWLLATLLAFAIVTLVGFLGIGVIGLLIWFICTRVELESGGGVSPFVVTKREMTRAERAAHRHEQSLANQSTRFFRNVGMGLTLIGFAGFLYGLGAFTI